MYYKPKRSVVSEFRAILKDDGDIKFASFTTKKAREYCGYPKLKEKNN